MEMSKNLLLLLEKLFTFPTEQSELNAWWVPELGAKPPKPKKQQSGDDEDVSMEPSTSKNDDEEEEEEDDWRKFFDDEPAPSADPKAPLAGVRLHQLTLHQSLHSLASHKAIFTRAWLSLLPRIAATSSEETRRALSVRVLNILHRGVLPHLTRPILVMDWVGNCVDMGESECSPFFSLLSFADRFGCMCVGGSVGLLALNGLFSLMKDYNLCVVAPLLPSHSLFIRQPNANLSLSE